MISKSSRKCFPFSYGRFFHLVEKYPLLGFKLSKFYGKKDFYSHVSVSLTREAETAIDSNTIEFAYGHKSFGGSVKDVNSQLFIYDDEQLNT